MRAPPRAVVIGCDFLNDCQVKSSVDRANSLSVKSYRNASGLDTV